MIVVDASVLANVVGDGGAAGKAARARLLEARDVAVPDLVDVETAAVLRKWWLADGLPNQDFALALDDLRDLPMTRYPAWPFLPRMFSLRSNLSVYDGLYVALALELQCPLLTLDARLARAPGPRCPIELLGV